jgi:hypothetical protein
VQKQQQPKSDGQQGPLAPHGAGNLGYSIAIVPLLSASGRSRRTVVTGNDLKLIPNNKIKPEMDKGIPANRTGTNIHPNNGVVKRITGGFAPQQSCLSLIGQPNSLQSTVHVVAIRCGLVYCLGNAHPHTLQNLHWIMLHPSAKYPEREKLYREREKDRDRERILITYPASG